MRQLWIKSLIVFGLLLCGLSGAIQAGEVLLTEKVVNQIKPGMTRQEVRGLAGEPGRIKENKDGTQVWFYTRKEKSSKPPAPELPYPIPSSRKREIGARVHFNAEGIVADVKQRIFKQDLTSRLVTAEQFSEEMGS